jgi:chromosome segregation ATPase
MANQKLSTEELQQIQTIQTRNRNLITELGEIEVMFDNLKTRKENAFTYLAQLRQEEQSLGKALTEKYGDGTVDLGTGEFVPSSSDEAGE